MLWRLLYYLISIIFARFISISPFCAIYIMMTVMTLFWSEYGKILLHTKIRNMKCKNPPKWTYLEAVGQDPDQHVPLRVQLQAQLILLPASTDLFGPIGLNNILFQQPDWLTDPGYHEHLKNKVHIQCSVFKSSYLIL